MKKTGILFTAPMVRAILAGTKTQTRRPVKPQPFEGGRPEHWSISEFPQFCPYGQPGDHLWVRETFFAWGRWETRFSAKKGRDEWHFIDMTLECGRTYLYAAEEHPQPQPMGGKPHRGGVTPKWWKRPAIFMPLAACRITPELTGVRVERLQEISESDAIAEGIERDQRLDPAGTCHWRVYGKERTGTNSPERSYQTLWESINSPESWAANPWVWVVEFSAIESLKGKTP